MTDDLLIPLEEKPSKPLTTWRVVLISAFVALIIGCLPALTTALIVGDNIKQTQSQIIEGRIHTTRVLCERINQVVDSTGLQTDYLENLVLEGAKSSKLFEKFYRQANAPSYSERVKQSQRVAKGLDTRKTKRLDCDSLVAEVSRQK